MANIAVGHESISSAYIHIPFCSHKCEFCDFAAVAGMSHLEDEYTEVICNEIRDRIATTASEIRINTVFFGGGTPGLVAPSTLERIFQALYDSCTVESDLEFSMETTPHSITEEKARAWRSLGINRISIGVESLRDDELSAIGRDHTRAQALSGLEIACRHFDNVNVDFMYGLPTQTIESWGETLDDLTSLTSEFPSIKHVSSYCLELATNSPLLSRFPRSSIDYPHDDSIADFFLLLVQKLSDSGFSHYEVSNFARPGFACRHNLVYWHNLEYLAFGVGSHRYVDGVRSSNFRSLAKYMREYTADEMSENIDESTRIKEGLMLGLRMRQGIILSEFVDRYGIDLATRFARQIEKLRSGGLIEFDGSRLRISDSGVLVSNAILAEFM